MFPISNNDSSNQQLIERFQQEIGIDAFNRAKREISPDTGVVLTKWPNMMRFFPATETGWILEDDSTYFEPNGIMERDWTFDKDDNSRITVWVFVSNGSTPDDLLSMLAQFGVMTSKLNAYKLGPADLGNISIMTNDEEPYIDDVFWVNQNVLIKISRRESTADVLTIAYSINNFLNQNISSDISTKGPRITNIAISPHKPKVNETISLKLHTASESDALHLLGPGLENTDEEIFDIQEQNKLTIKLKITKAGTYEIPMWVADKLTLLSTRIVTQITVLPQDKSNDH